MAGITLAQAEAKLATWLAADDAVARGQSYSVAGRQLTRANLQEIREAVTWWDGKVKRLARTSGARVIVGRP
ncbi:MAG: DUF6148 family protein, partial [Alphaproteobacteria bacterium]